MNVIRSLMDATGPLVRAKRAIVGPTRPTWPADFEIVANVMRFGATPSTFLPLAFQRAVLDPPRPATRDMRACTFTRVDAGGVPADWCVREGVSGPRVVLYFHGGGYSTGSPRSHRDLVARLARTAGARVLVADYRLAPESPYPAAVQDALRVYRWLIGPEGIDPKHIVVAGDSAGGGLSAAMLLAQRDAGGALPAGAALISPWLDMRSELPSIDGNGRWDYVNRPALAAYRRRYVKDEELDLPYASPIRASLEALPPMLVQVGELECLRDEGIDFVRRAKLAGCDARLEVWTDMVHAFHMFAPMLPVAALAIEGMGAFARECAPT